MTMDHAEALPREYQLLEYRLLEVVGEGGFGITYLAHDSTLDCQVAIKEYLPVETARRTTAAYTVRPRSSNTESDFNWGLDQFLEEARGLNRLNHPNIIRVRRFFKENGTAYLVMDYAKGPTLEAWLDQHGVLSYAETVDLMRPLLDGLEHVHRISYLHRDIKPDNIILRDAQQVGVRNPVLIDFGAARQAIGTRTKKLTTLVSAGYSPLEQYAANRPQSPASDIYALAGVMLRCLSGVEPQSSPERSLEDHLPAQLRQLEGHMPAAFLGALERALSLKSADRQQSVEMLRRELFPGDEVPAQPIVEITPSPEQATKPADEPGIESHDIDSRRQRRARNKGTVKYSAELEGDGVTGTTGEESELVTGVAGDGRQTIAPRFARWSFGRVAKRPVTETSVVNDTNTGSRNRTALGFAALAVGCAHLASMMYWTREILSTDNNQISLVSLPLAQLFVAYLSYRFLFTRIRSGGATTRLLLGLLSYFALSSILPSAFELAGDSESRWRQGFIWFPLATVIVAYLSHRFLFKRGGSPITRLLLGLSSYFALSILSCLFWDDWDVDGQATHLLFFRWQLLFAVATYEFELFFLLYMVLCMNHSRGLEINPNTWRNLPSLWRKLLAVGVALVLIHFGWSYAERSQSDLAGQVHSELERAGYDAGDDVWEPGAPDYKISKKMEEAITRFQKHAGIPVNGQVSEELLDRLQRSPTKTTWNVAADGSGDARTIGEALSAINRVDSATQKNIDEDRLYRVVLAPGVYRENVGIDGKEHQKIILAGPAGKRRAIIEGTKDIDSVLRISGAEVTLDGVGIVQRDNGEANRPAIQLTGAGHYTFRNVIVQGAKDGWGVYVTGPTPDEATDTQEGATLDLSGSDIRGGIGMTGKVAGRIAGSRVSSIGRTYAMRLGGQVAPDIEDNDISNPVYIEERAAPILVNNRVSSRTDTTIAIVGGNGPILRGNRLRSEDGNCITIRGAAGTSIVEDNIMEECDGYPDIAVTGGAKASLRNNRLTANEAGQPDIYISEDTQVEAEGNTVTR